jgi:hypothetical protein
VINASILNVFPLPYTTNHQGKKTIYDPPPKVVIFSETVEGFVLL